MFSVEKRRNIESQRGKNRATEKSPPRWEGGQGLPWRIQKPKQKLKKQRISKRKPNKNNYKAEEQLTNKQQ